MGNVCPASSSAQTENSTSIASLCVTWIGVGTLQFSTEHGSAEDATHFGTELGLANVSAGFLP